MSKSFKRWILAFAHDGQPVDGLMFVHKSKIENHLQKLKNKSAFIIKQVSIVDLVENN